MTADPRTTEEIARGIRETHLFTVSLAAAAGNKGDLKEACDLAEQAISAALTSERERGEREREKLAAALDEALGMFLCTQRLDHYPADHWSNVANTLLPRKKTKRGEGADFITEYVVLCGQFYGSPGTGYSCEYAFDGERFADRTAAIDHGFDVRGSDDFNIGVLCDGKLISLDWMDEVVDTKADVLARIAESAGLKP